MHFTPNYVQRFWISQNTLKHCLAVAFIFSIYLKPVLYCVSFIADKSVYHKIVSCKTYVCAQFKYVLSLIKEIKVYSLINIFRIMFINVLPISYKKDNWKHLTISAQSVWKNMPFYTVFSLTELRPFNTSGWYKPIR